MSIPTYTPGYPPDNYSLGQTKAVIRNNLDGTFLTLAVDHVNNNGPDGKPAGYHTIIHSVPQAADPAAVPGYGQLYSKTIDDVTDDQALFWQTGAGVIQQLTTNFNPVAGLPGMTFLPGGIILQWNANLFIEGDNAATFAGSGSGKLGASAFPNNCFGIIANMAESSSSDGNLNTYNLTKTGFRYNNSSNSNRTYFWMAIGN